MSQPHEHQYIRAAPFPPGTAPWTLLMVPCEASRRGRWLFKVGRGACQPPVSLSADVILAAVRIPLTLNLAGQVERQIVLTALLKIASSPRNIPKARPGLRYPLLLGKSWGTVVRRSGFW